MTKSCRILLSNFEHAVPYGVTDCDIVKATRDHAMSDGFCCWLDHMHGSQELPVPEDAESMIVTFWPNNPYIERRAAQRGISVDDYIEWAFAQIRRLLGELGNRFVWCIGWETFLTHTWCREDGSQPKFSTRAEGFAFYKQWVRTSLHTKHWRNTRKFGEARFNTRPSALEFICRKALSPGDFNLMLGSTYSSHAHYAFAAVPEAVGFWWECGITSVNLQVGFSFVRGAARQYGKRWLADVSPYCYPYPLHPDGYYEDLGEWGKFEEGIEGHCRLNFPKYTPERVRLAGYTPEMILRCWLTALMSGCDYLFHEASSLTHFVRIGDRLELTPFGLASKRLAEFKRSLPERRKPLTPVALLLDFHHGIEPYSMEQPWGYADSAPGDAQILDFYQTAYPGHSLPALTAPWKNLKEYGDMLRAGFDFRPYERRIVCNGRWPDMFDVYLSNASEETFSDSKIMVLLGHQNFTPEKEALLLKLVHSGRNLVVTLDQLNVGGCALEDIKLNGDERNACFVVDAVSGEQTPEHAFRVQPLSAQGWDVLLMADNQHPLLLKKRHGAGNIYLFACRHALDLDHHLLNAYVRFLDTLFDPLLPFQFSDRAIQRIVNKTDDGCLLTLINNGAEQWWGKITGRNLHPSAIRECWEEKSVVWHHTTAEFEMEIAVPAFGFKVLKVCYSK